MEGCWLFNGSTGCWMLVGTSTQCNLCQFLASSNSIQILQHALSIKMTSVKCTCVHCPEHTPVYTITSSSVNCSPTLRWDSLQTPLNAHICLFELVAITKCRWRCWMWSLQVGVVTHKEMKIQFMTNSSGDIPAVGMSVAHSRKSCNICNIVPWQNCTLFELQ